MRQSSWVNVIHLAKSSLVYWTLKALIRMLFIGFQISSRNADSPTSYGSRIKRTQSVLLWMKLSSAAVALGLWCLG